MSLLISLLHNIHRLLLFSFPISGITRIQRQISEIQVEGPPSKGCGLQVPVFHNADVLTLLQWREDNTIREIAKFGAGITFQRFSLLQRRKINETKDYERGNARQRKEEQENVCKSGFILVEEC